jgi:hypothetical protein
VSRAVEEEKFLPARSNLTATVVTTLMRTIFTTALFVAAMARSDVLNAMEPGYWIDAEATLLLKNVEGIGHVAFTAQDVIRHELVQRIVEAYDQALLKTARSHEGRE